MADGNITFGNTVLATLSANIGLSSSILVDQYIGQANLIETVSNVAFVSSGIYSKYTPILTQQSGNVIVGNVTYDQLVAQANIVETIANVKFSANVVRSNPAGTIPTLSAILPMITYSASDGNPIVIFSGQSGNAVIPTPTTTQYWAST